MAKRISARDAAIAEKRKILGPEPRHSKYPNYTISGKWIGPKKTDTNPPVGIAQQKTIG